jgi:hypothetical protein
MASTSWFDRRFKYFMNSSESRVFRVSFIEQIALYFTSQEFPHTHPKVCPVFTFPIIWKER